MKGYPSHDEIEHALTIALESLISTDQHLIAVSANERSMTHRIGHYLQLLLPLWHVDCEYNRDGHEPKVTNLKPLPTSTANTHGATVYPDVIVHHRGTNENLLILEVKKSTHTDIGEDVDKLQSYLRKPLLYTYGAQVIIDTNHSLGAPYIITWFLRAD